MNAQTAVPTASLLHVGDRVPHRAPRTRDRASFAIDTLAGRYLVFCFFGSTADPRGRAALEVALRHRDRFDDRRASFFGVSVDPGDEDQDWVRDLSPGFRIAFDFDGALSSGYGVTAEGDGAGTGARAYRRCWVIVDPTLRVAATFPFAEDGDAQVFAYLDGLPAPADYAGFEIPAPVLVLPNVFEPDLCRQLVARYDAEGGTESGFQRDNAARIDHNFKRRKDVTIDDPELIRRIQTRINRRVVPEIERLFFMQITRMERYIVGCYAAEDGGHFAAHRDNRQGLTAHRRFAVSINLTGDFEGGDVSFPEYNLRGIKAPPGWAVVFPANILHKVARVVRGRRYAFLPFVYDETGAQIRQRELARHANEARAAEVPASEVAVPDTPVAAARAATA